MESIFISIINIILIVLIVALILFCIFKAIKYARRGTVSKDKNDEKPV
jgi:nitric oxide reductase large subunit